MLVVFLILAVLVVLGAALVLAGRWDAATTTDDHAAPTLPSGPWTAADVSNLTFRVGLRGYRMEDVDAALAAIAAGLPGGADPQQPDPPPAGALPPPPSVGLPAGDDPSAGPGPDRP